MLAKAVHSMIRVREEARSVAFYQAAFGLEVAERFDFPTFTLIYLRNAESSFEVELTVNKDQNAPYDLGNGYGHLAVVVPDVDMARAQAVAAGMPATECRDFQHDGATLARFFFMTDPDGYKIEVIRKGGRFG